MDNQIQVIQNDSHKMRTFLIIVNIVLLLLFVGWYFYRSYFQTAQLQSSIVSVGSSTPDNAISVQSQESDPISVRRMKYTEILLRYQGQLSALEAQRINATPDTDTANMDTKIADLRQKVSHIEALIKKLTES